MQKLSKLILLTTYLSLFTFEALAADVNSIKSTDKTALLDGRCGNDEWQVATKIALPAQAVIYLMHDKDYFYICAKGKPDDIVVLDLFIAHAGTGELHKFHLSAQMGESVLKGNKWENVSPKWQLNDYAGFWVPYAGLKDREKRQGPKFARGTHRQVQISRNKFPGDSWNMMFEISAVKHQGKMTELVYPENAVGNNQQTWSKFTFSDKD